MKFTKSIQDTESIIGYKFKNKQNLKNSLIHPSYYKNKKIRLSGSNEFERFLVSCRETLHALIKHSL